MLTRAYTCWNVKCKDVPKRHEVVDRFGNGQDDFHSPEDALRAGGARRMPRRRVRELFRLPREWRVLVLHGQQGAAFLRRADPVREHDTL